MEQHSPEPTVPRSHLLPRSPKTWLWIAWFLIAWAALQFPGWQVANRVEPFVFGLPFMFFWALLWWLLLVISIVILARRNDESADGRHVENPMSEEGRR